jgi:hypothetical protein
MKNKLHVIASGCSFTSNFRPNIEKYNMVEDLWKKEPKEIFTWFQWLSKIYGKEVDAEFYNYGAITNDNKTIIRSIFYKVNDLVFNQGVKPEDIIVLIQWTSLTRNSWFISNTLYDPNNNVKKNFIEKNDSPPHTNDFIGWDKKSTGYEHGYFYLSGGYFNETFNPDKMDEFAITYLQKVMSKDERYMDWFDSIIGLFSYLEQLGVKKIKTFQMNNNFSKSYMDESKTPPSYDEEKKRKNMDTYDCIIKEKIICNTWNDTDLCYDNPYVKIYADRVDFDKYFWFYEEENLHKRGGIIEWSIRNFNEDLDDGNYDLPKVLWREMNNLDEDDQRKYLNNSWYGHTSSVLARKFVNDVVLKWDIFK